MNTNTIVWIIGEGCRDDLDLVCLFKWCNQSEGFDLIWIVLKICLIIYRTRMLIGNRIIFLDCDLYRKDLFPHPKMHQYIDKNDDNRLRPFIFNWPTNPQFSPGFGYILYMLLIEYKRVAYTYRCNIHHPSQHNARSAVKLHYDRGTPRGGWSAPFQTYCPAKKRRIKKPRVKYKAFSLWPNPPSGPPKKKALRMEVVTCVFGARLKRITRTQTWHVAYRRGEWCAVFGGVQYIFGCLACASWVAEIEGVLFMCVSFKHVVCLSFVYPRVVSSYIFIHIDKAVRTWLKSTPWRRVPLSG